MAAAAGGGEQYIQFADPVVEQICATNWGDGVGITPSQAAAVTAIPDSVFSYNTQITQFPELVYFIGLTNIGSGVFRNCTSLYSIGVPPNIVSMQMRGAPITEIHITDLDKYLRGQNGTTYFITASTPATGAHLYLNGAEVTSVTFPTGMTAIPAHVLQNHKYITSAAFPGTITSIEGLAFSDAGLVNEVSLPEGLTSIGENAFSNCPLSGVLVIPSTVTEIIGQTFRNSTGVTAAKVLATTPPTLSDRYAFRYTSYPIYVPYSADHSILAAYQAASNWSVYASRIYELNPDGTIPS